MISVGNLKLSFNDIDHAAKRWETTEPMLAVIKHAKWVLFSFYGEQIQM